MDLTAKPKLRNPGATALRDRNCIQVDIDPSHSLLIAGDVPRIRQFLAKLNGEHTAHQLINEFDFAQTALFQLEQRGLLEAELLDSEITCGLSSTQLHQLLISQRSQQAAIGDLNFATNRIRNLAASYIWIATAGPVSALLALLLAEQHIGRIKLAKLNDFKPSDLPNWLSSQQSAPVALQVAMQARSPNLKLNQPAGQPEPDLIIYADQPWLDPNSTADLLNREVAHLVISPKITEVIVGPLVLPRKTGCLICQELNLTAIDKSWPVMRNLISPQLHDQTDPLLIQLTTAFAASQITHGIASGNLSNCALAGTKWRFRLPGPNIAEIKSPINMFCSCQWGELAA